MEHRIRELYNKSILNNTLSRYNIDKKNCHLLDGFESYVYQIEKNNEQYILKISHSIRRDKTMIEGEAHFINYLSNHGLTIPQVIYSSNNNLIETIPAEEGYFTSTLFQHAPGKPPNKQSWNKYLFITMGKYLGKLHSISKTYAPVTKYRPDIFKESEAIVKFFPENDHDVKKIYNDLFTYFNSLPQDTDSFGLIHVDFHGGNFFINNGNIYLFDFDDCQYSWFVHDIAMAFFYSLPHHCENNKQIENGYLFLNNFLKGYYQENNLDKEWLTKIPDFLKLRELELYALINRSFDLNNLDPWSERFMKNRKEKIIQNIPFFDFDPEKLSL